VIQCGGQRLAARNRGQSYALGKPRDDFQLNSQRDTAEEVK
jgi:hypothetical protein